MIPRPACSSLATSISRPRLSDRLTMSASVSDLRDDVIGVKRVFYEKCKAPIGLRGEHLVIKPMKQMTNGFALLAVPFPSRSQDPGVSPYRQKDVRSCRIQDGLRKLRYVA